MKSPPNFADVAGTIVFESGSVSASVTFLPLLLPLTPVAVALSAKKERTRRSSSRSSASPRTPRERTSAPCRRCPARTRYWSFPLSTETALLRPCAAATGCRRSA